MEGQRSTEDGQYPEGSLKVCMKFMMMIMSWSLYGEGRRSTMNVLICSTRCQIKSSSVSISNSRSQSKSS